MSEKLERFEYLTRMGFDNRTDEQAELRFYFNSLESNSITTASRIAALEAQNKKLVEALEKIKRQDPYTTTNKSFFDFVYNTAKNALSEVTQ